MRIAIKLSAGALFCLLGVQIAAAVAAPPANPPAADKQPPTVKITPPERPILNKTIDVELFTVDLPMSVAKKLGFDPDGKNTEPYQKLFKDPKSVAAAIEAAQKLSKDVHVDSRPDVIAVGEFGFCTGYGDSETEPQVTLCAHRKDIDASKIEVHVSLGRITFDTKCMFKTPHGSKPTRHVRDTDEDVTLQVGQSTMAASLIYQTDSTDTNRATPNEERILFAIVTGRPAKSATAKSTEFPAKR